MRKILLLLCSLIPFTCCYSQYLHTPKDIKKLIKNSSYTYVFDSIGLHQLNKSYLNLNSFEETLAKPTELLTQKGTEKYLFKGNKNFDKGKYAKAVKYYDKALALDPSNIQLLKLMSKAQFAQQAYEKGVSYLEQISVENPQNFEVHIDLAQHYTEMGNKIKALRHISIAHLMNRNDTATLEELKLIYLKFGLDYGDWSFSPAYEISKSAQEIRISFDSKPAEAYASCKAVWLFEEGYREKMQKLSDQKIEIIEEKECLLNALISYEYLPETAEKSPVFDYLAKILSEGEINNFINYEILSRKNPRLFKSFTAKEQEVLIVYLMETRSSLVE